MYTKQLVQIIILLFAFIFIFSACSDSKIATRSYNRFVKHGGKIEYRTIPLDTDNDSIYNSFGEYKGLRKNLYPCICEDVHIPVPKYVYRFETKRFNDSIKWMRRMLSDSASSANKASKQEDKHIEKMYKSETKRLDELAEEKRKLEVKLKRAESNWKLWYILGFFSCLLLLILLWIVRKWLKM